MINSISPLNSDSPMISQSSLSTEQKNVIANTLSQFNPDSLSEEEAQTIVNNFSEAGIAPSRALGGLMADAGFDARSVAELAGVGKGQGPPPQSRQNQLELMSMVDFLTELVSDTIATEGEYANLTQEKKASIYAQVVDEFGLQPGQSVIDIKV